MSAFRKLTVARARSVVRVLRRHVHQALRAGGNISRALWWFVRRPKDFLAFAGIIGADLRRLVIRSLRRKRGSRSRLSAAEQARRTARMGAAAPVFRPADFSMPASGLGTPDTHTADMGSPDGGDGPAVHGWTLADLPSRAVPDLPALPAGCGLRTGDLWLLGDMMRLRLEPEEGALRRDCVLRARQLDIAAGAEAALGAWPVGAAEACVFLDIPLRDGFAPVLFTLGPAESTADSPAPEAALLAFPSLARGGAHYGELCAIAPDTPYPASLAEASRRFAAAMWAEPRTAGFRVGRLDVDMRAATGAEPLFSVPARRWLEGLVGCAVAPGDLEGLAEPARAHFRKLAPAGGAPVRPDPRRAAGGALALPADALPTLSALTAPAGPDATGPVAGPVAGSFILTTEGRDRVELVAFRCAHPALAGLQPRWAPLALPLLPSGSDAADPAPQAIRFTFAPLRETEQTLFPTPANLAGPLLRNAPEAEARPLVVLFDALSDPQRDARALQSLREQRGVGPIEVFARRRRPRARREDALGEALETLFPDAWRILSAPAGSADGLERFLERLDGASALFLCGATILHDLRSLATLQRLAQVEGVGAVGCGLVHVSVKAKQPDVGELAPLMATPPARARGPKPSDALRRMGPATLPVAAVDARLALLPGGAIEAAGGFGGTRSGEAGETLQSAMTHYCAAARAAGMTHFATTAVTASLCNDVDPPPERPAEACWVAEVAA